MAANTVGTGELVSRVAVGLVVGLVHPLLHSVDVLSKNRCNHSTGGIYKSHKERLWWKTNMTFPLFCRNLNVITNNFFKKRIVVSKCFVIKITILSFKFGNLIEMNRACELSFPCRMHLEIRQYLCAKAYAHVYLQVHTVQVCLSMCVFTKCQRTTLAESSWFPL